MNELEMIDFITKEIEDLQTIEHYLMQEIASVEVASNDKEFNTKMNIDRLYFLNNCLSNEIKEMKRFLKEKKVNFEVE
ncbi:hypothetical protein FC40_GL000711 [Ligilactobacillus hayakitensis DSM 18933 = JCM 14209]|uniref:Uncharacterized protein n=1 Tax=Ligilactobacillus hayakitensis DSM 18933 = JCM 14209 TaxID=1423755 RepID=A0A0R1WLT0_9LACO|nr:hypothetical protein [Ligilactobacillus hayakitensis]KRM18922.1 hypothetical protein FC40_GL000711 [Ligilactobacillus hayakitensis DSM 18933 = JCM 14209]